MTTPTRPTFAESMDKVRALCDAAGVDFYEVRRFASDHLSQQMRDHYGPDHGHGISSSDTNHHLVSLVEYDTEVLAEEIQRLADRNALVARIAESSGRTPEQTLAGLQALFAPKED